MNNFEILSTVTDFIEYYYPYSYGVLVFGSVLYGKDDYQDIDLLIIDNKFSYVSKSNFYYRGNYFNVIKVPSSDVFNLIAEDYKAGVYKNIFETGCILKDDLNILSLVKQFVDKNYPNTDEVVTYHINRCISEINESVIAIKREYSSIHSFLIFSNLVSLLIDFIILEKGKINLYTIKHKSQYLYNYHFKESTIINRIIDIYHLDSSKAISEILEFIKSRNISKTPVDYDNDYLINSLNSLQSLVIYIPKQCSILLYYKFCNELNNNKIEFYSYRIDRNNVEGAGIYFIVKCIEKENFIKVRKFLKDSLGNKPFFFPYNIWFNQEIKFGGSFNYKVAQDLFLNIQSIIERIRNDKKECIRFILYIVYHMNISFDEIAAYYFYSTINNSHSFSIEDIIEKEMEYKMKNETKEFETLVDVVEIKFNTIFDFSRLKIIPKYFQIQIFDRVLSMFFFNDSEKRQIMMMLKDQNFINV